MVRLTRQACAQIGRLATPTPDKLGVTVEDKAKDFFREVCRWVPWTIKNYKLDELTSAPALRSNLSFMFKQYAHIKNPKVVDVLIYKGREELESVALQHKQRHHLISIFLNEPAARKKELQRLDGAKISEFLENFYQNK